jgi:hypothetical protein
MHSVMDLLPKVEIWAGFRRSAAAVSVRGTRFPMPAFIHDEKFKL